MEFDGLLGKITQMLKQRIEAVGFDPHSIRAIAGRRFSPPRERGKAGRAVRYLRFCD